MNNTYTINPNLEVMEIDGERVIMNAEHFTITKLNEIGGEIFSMLQKNLPFSQIKENIMSQFEVEESVVEEDIHSFIKDLTDANLISKV